MERFMLFFILIFAFLNCNALRDDDKIRQENENICALISNSLIDNSKTRDFFLLYTICVQKKNKDDNVKDYGD